MVDGYIAAYLAQFNIDPGTLGDLAGQGTQHYIYAYPQDRIIKIPKKSLLVSAYGGLSAAAIKRDVDILKRYLPDYVVDTAVLYGDNGSYVVIQDRLHNPEFITSVNFPLIRHDFERIVESDRRMIRDHCLTLDLLGNIGWWRCLAASLLRQKNRAFMNNLLLTRHNGQCAVKIVDINLIHPYRHCARGIGLLRSVIDMLYFQISRFLIRDNFGVAF